MLNRHLVEQDGEDTLLHLSGILGTKYNHLFLGKVNADRGGRGHTLRPSVGRERSGIVDNVVRVEMLKLFPLRADEHVAHEQSMVSAGADDTDVDAVTFIPSCVSIDNVDAISGVEVINGTLSVDSPDLQMGKSGEKVSNGSTE